MTRTTKYLIVIILVCLTRTAGGCSFTYPDPWNGAWPACHEVKVYIDSRFSDAQYNAIVNTFQQWQTSLAGFGVLTSNSITFKDFIKQSTLVTSASNDVGTDVYQVINDAPPTGDPNDVGYTGPLNTGSRAHAWTYLKASALTSTEALKRLMAHEIGHSFALADCYSVCALGSTIMVGRGDINDVTTPTLPDGPTACDAILVEGLNGYWYGMCSDNPSSAAATAPVACLASHPTMSFDGFVSNRNQCSGWWDYGACGCQALDCGMNPDDHAVSVSQCESYGYPWLWCDSPDCGCFDPDSTCGLCPSEFDDWVNECQRNHGDVSDCMCYIDPTPIVIDTSGNGFHLTSAANGVQFTFGGLKPIQVAWTEAGSANALLVLDRNHNGKIDNATELFGNLTKQPASTNPNGFAALAEFDKPENGGNGDGIIDFQDAIFSSLRLWIDLNHNGVSEPEELFTLPALGVYSISLDYSESRRRDKYGNEFRYRAKVNGAPGTNSGRWAYDVILNTVQRSAAISSSNTCSAQQLTDRPVPVEKQLSESVRK